MKTQSVHEVGTMKYFQERTMRHNVYSDIKKDVNGFQDFFLSVGRAYLAAAFTEYFTIDSSTGKPTVHIPPPNIEGANQVEYFEQFSYFQTILGCFSEIFLRSSAVNFPRKF